MPTLIISKPTVKELIIHQNNERPIVTSNKTKYKKAAHKRAALQFVLNNYDYYRLENCLRRLALRKPTFFRSTSRASLVTKPALLKIGFSVSS